MAHRRQEGRLVLDLLLETGVCLFKLNRALAHTGLQLVVGNLELLLHERKVSLEMGHLAEGDAAAELAAQCALSHLDRSTRKLLQWPAHQLVQRNDNTCDQLNGKHDKEPAEQHDRLGMALRVVGKRYDDADRATHVGKGHHIAVADVSLIRSNAEKFRPSGFERRDGIELERVGRGRRGGAHVEEVHTDLRVRSKRGGAVLCAVEIAVAPKRGDLLSKKARFGKRSLLVCPVGVLGKHNGVGPEREKEKRQDRHDKHGGESARGALGVRLFITAEADNFFHEGLLTSHRLGGAAARYKTSPPDARCRTGSSNNNWRPK